MDKRLVLAAGLSFLILLAWSWMFPPPQPPAPTPGDEPVAEELEASPRPAEPAEVEPSPEVEAYTEAEPIRAQFAEELRVANGLFEVTLTNRGGLATSWKLIDDTTGGAPLELLPQYQGELARTLGIELGDAGLSKTLNEALYTVEREPLPGEPGMPAGERIRFTWSDGRGLEARKSLTFREGSYLVAIDLDIVDRGRSLPAGVVLGPGFGAQDGQDKGGMGTYYYEAVAWNRGGQVVHTKNVSLDDEIGGSERLRWAGLEDQYFAALLVPGDPEAAARWRNVELREPPTEDGEEGDEKQALLLSMVAPSGELQLYVGPKKYRLLEELGNELEKAVWFSSYDFLAWISRVIFFGLLWIHAHTIDNYGMAIILCTFLLRLLLFPVNQYSMVSMKKTQMQMQRLQPKIKAIKNKYKKVKDAESRAKMNQEMMDLYKREGVNPMGGVSGCLPLLAQFPILMGFYFMLTVAVELRGAPFFGWIKDLSVADPLFVTPVLMGVTMFVQQKMAMSKVKDPMQQQQQKIMMIMPFVFTWICIQMPAGMVLYWFVNNLLGIGQQWLVNRHTTRLEAAAQKA